MITTEERSEDAEALWATTGFARMAREKRRVRLVQTSTIRAAEAKFTICPYVPRGELTWFEGSTKSGKTMVAVDIAARVSHGTPFVNGEPIALGRVAILSCEDDPARTIVPRLIAAGADMDRVSILRVEEKGEQQTASFDLDLPMIEAELRAKEITLVIVDGTFGMLGAKDSNSYTEAYKAMLPFIAMIRALDIGAIAIRHTRKTDASAIHRGIGSVGFGALARSIVSIATDRDDDKRRLFAHAGGNLGETGATYSFRIEGASIHDFERAVGRVVWEDGIVDMSADDAMLNRTGTAEDASERDVAVEFLEGFLDCSMPSKDVFVASDKQGIARRTLYRAAKRCGVKIERRGLKFGSGSLWSPPSDPNRATEPQSCHLNTCGTNGAIVAPMEESVATDGPEIDEEETRL